MKRTRHGCWVLTLAAIGATASWPGAVLAESIRVWPTATVRGDAVTLGDIAELKGFESDTEARLSAIVVQAAPHAGGQVLVLLSDIRGALGDAGANLATTRVFGASRCKVSRPRPCVQKCVEPAPLQAPAPKIVTPEKPIVQAGTLEASLRRFIAARAADRDAQLEIRFSPANRSTLELASPEYTFEIHPRGDSALGLLSFEVDLVRGGQFERTVPVVAEVTMTKEVVVARRAINRGQTIEGRDLKLEERRFSKLQDIGMTDLAGAIGRRAKAFLQEGTMLAARQVEEKPIVDRGDRVTIWSRRGPLVIKTTGHAQQDGRLGDVISVRRDGVTDRKDLIDAVVTGPATVSLDGANRMASR